MTTTRSNANIIALTKLVRGKIVANKKNTIITGFNSIDTAKKGEITFLTNGKYSSLVRNTRASAILVSESGSIITEILQKIPSSLTVIAVRNPDLAFTKIVDYIKPAPKITHQGIHPNALIAQGVKLGKNVSIHAFAVIESDSSIADKTVIYPNVYIGRSVRIGKNCLIYPNVVIREETIIGNNVIIHGGTVIGSDGFGFTEANGKRIKIPQRGNVIIKDDVEIGANVTIARARFGSTIIGKSVKIDNLVHIAHNVEVGDNTVIVAGVGISGSSKIGRNVILAGQSGVSGHIQIGDNVRVGAKAGVMKDIPANTTVAGFPARPYRQHLKEQALLSKLPQIINKLKSDWRS